MVDGCTILAVIVSLDLLLDLFHVLDAGLPSLFGHLGLLVEPCEIGLAVAAAKTIPQRGELAVVIAVDTLLATLTNLSKRVDNLLEVKVVGSVAGRTVDDRVVGNVLAVVNENGPEVDEHEQSDIGHFL